MSPTFFAACLQEEFRTLDWEKVGVFGNGEYPSKLRFADDVALLSKSGEELQSTLSALEKHKRTVGLEIICRKLK